MAPSTWVAKERRMSLSDRSANQGFQRIGWPSADAERRPVGPDGAGFQNLSHPRKPAAASTSGFVSPYVSERKLQEINEADRRAQGPPEPDIEEIKNRAYKEGFAKGEKEGLKAGQEQARVEVERMQQILSDMSRVWEQIVAGYETQIVTLVCRVAEKVVCGQVAVDDEVVKRSILNAFSAVPEPEDVSIDVNPKDYEYIETIKDDFFECISSLRDVSVSADPSVPQGGCKIRTRAGQVDGTLQARLEAVQKSLTETNGQKKGVPAQ